MFQQQLRKSIAPSKMCCVYVCVMRADKLTNPCLEMLLSHFCLATDIFSGQKNDHFRKKIHHCCGTSLLFPFLSLLISKKNSLVSPSVLDRNTEVAYNFSFNLKTHPSKCVRGSFRLGKGAAKT